MMYYQREFHIHVNILKSRISFSSSENLQNTIKINLVLLHKHAGNILFIDTDTSYLVGLSVQSQQPFQKFIWDRKIPLFPYPSKTSLLVMLTAESNLFAF